MPEPSITTPEPEPHEDVTETASPSTSIALTWVVLPGDRAAEAPGSPGSDGSPGSLGSPGPHGSTDGLSTTRARALSVASIALARATAYAPGSKQAGGCRSRSLRVWAMSVPPELGFGLVRTRYPRYCAAIGSRIATL